MNGTAKNRKLKCLCVSADFLLELFKQGRKRGYDVVRDAVPDDAVLVRVVTDHRQPGLCFIVQSESFPEVVEGGIIPDFYPLCQTRPE